MRKIITFARIFESRSLFKRILVGMKLAIRLSKRSNASFNISITKQHDYSTFKYWTDKTRMERCK
ncbi:hypothetical protein D1953_20030 [Peribacillus asahii]|uniref:Uncharacterized protein n=1 Tax=Peribacillus asahii TaxID=228899 RepID=A0A398AXB0_9BACI|nr:hypothetical protein D1953_20030 [Peribacillus asahii]